MKFLCPRLPTHLRSLMVLQCNKKCAPAPCLPSPIAFHRRAQTPRIQSRAINRVQLQQVTLGNKMSAHRCDCELGESRPCPHPASFAYISLATSLPSLGLHFGTRPIEGDDPPLGNGKTIMVLHYFSVSLCLAHAPDGYGYVKLDKDRIFSWSYYFARR